MLTGVWIRLGGLVFGKELQVVRWLVLQVVLHIWRGDLIG